MQEPLCKGFLFVQRSSIIFQQKWRQKYCAVFAQSHQGLARIEAYRSENDFWLGRKARHFLLSNCIAIRSINNSNNIVDKLVIFQVVTHHTTLELGTTADDVAKLWMSALSQAAFPAQYHHQQQQFQNSNSNQLQSNNNDYAAKDSADYDEPWDAKNLQLEVLDSWASRRLGLVGHFDLVLTADGFILKSKEGVAKAWPFAELVRIGYGTDCFFLQTINQDLLEFRCADPGQLLEKVRSYVALSRELGNSKTSEIIGLRGLLKQSYSVIFTVRKASTSRIDGRASISSMASSDVSAGDIFQPISPRSHFQLDAFKYADFRAQPSNNNSVKLAPSQPPVTPVYATPMMPTTTVAYRPKSPPSYSPPSDIISETASEQRLSVWDKIKKPGSRGVVRRSGSLSAINNTNNFDTNNNKADAARHRRMTTHQNDLRLADTHREVGQSKAVANAARKWYHNLFSRKSPAFQHDLQHDRQQLPLDDHHHNASMTSTVDDYGTGFVTTSSFDVSEFDPESRASRLRRSFRSKLSSRKSSAGSNADRSPTENNRYYCENSSSGSQPAFAAGRFVDFQQEPTRVGQQQNSQRPASTTAASEMVNKRMTPPPQMLTYRGGSSSTGLNQHQQLFRSPSIPEEVVADDDHNSIGAVEMRQLAERIAAAERVLLPHNRANTYAPTNEVIARYRQVVSEKTQIENAASTPNKLQRAAVAAPAANQTDSSKVWPQTKTTTTITEIAVPVGRIQSTNYVSSANKHKLQSQGSIITEVW